MEEKTKPNCYDCKHQGGLPGSAHSCCKHPLVAAERNDGALGALAILAGVGRVSPMVLKKMGVTGNPTGIARGWFNWPWNFDPTWLLTCDGFEPKKEAVSA